MTTKSFNLTTEIDGFCPDFGWWDWERQEKKNGKWERIWCNRARLL